MASNPAAAAAGLPTMTASIGTPHSNWTLASLGAVFREAAVADGVDQHATAQPDVGKLAIVELHQPVEVAANDAPVLDLLEQPLNGAERGRPQGGEAGARAF